MQKNTKYLKSTLFICFLIFYVNIQAQNTENIANSLDSIEENNYSQIIKIAKRLEKQAKQENSNQYLIKAYNYLGKAYYQQKFYNKSIKYFDKELAIREKLPNNSDLLVSYYNLGSTCLKLHKNRKAITYFEKSLKKAQELNNTDLIKANHKALVISQEAYGNYKTANLHLKELLTTNEGMFSNKIELYKKEVVKQKSIATKKSKELNTTKEELQVSTEIINILEEDTLKKQQEIASLQFQKILKEYQFKQKEAELKLQKQITFLLIFGLVLISGLAILVFFLLLSKKRMNNKLKEQKDQIENQNIAIKSSIEYASKIQNVILPKEELFRKNFAEHLLFFKPRDVVSGDFYFFQKVNQHIVFAAVDCTGHGVPGAFLSMLGSAYLSEIIRRKETEEAGQVLDLLRNQIKSLLNQTGEQGEQKDGMDMALCVLNTDTHELQYAGAHNPLILIRDSILKEYKADRMPIGIGRKEKAFTNHMIQLKKGDQIYLYSDGFADQIGGEKNKKYKSKRFKTFLLQNSNLKMDVQKAMIEMEFDTWKGRNKQIDDITILAVKI